MNWVPFDMRARCSFRMLSIATVLCFVTLARPADAIHIEPIQTSLGSYEISLLPMDGEFELTDSKEAGVRLVGNLSNAPLLLGFHSSDVGKQTGQVTIQPNSEWCIVGDQLLVAFQSELRVYTVPDLKEVGRRSLGSDADPQTRGVPAKAPAKRVANGWHYDGSVFDNSGKTLRCLRYPRINVIPQTPEWETEKFQLEHWPLVLSVESGGLVLRGIRPFHEVFDRIPTKTLGDLSQLRVQFLRVHGDDCTMSFGKIGVHLRVIKFDGQKAGLPASLVLADDQPTFLLKDIAADLTHHFRDGRDGQAIVEFLSLDGQRKPSETLNVDQWIEHLVQLCSTEKKLTNPGSDSAEAAFQNLRPSLAAEFRRSTGRDPQGFPIPIPVQSRGLMMPRPLHYWVWTEVPEENLMLKLFPARLQAKRDSNRKAAEAVRDKSVAFSERISRGILGGLLAIVGLVGGGLIRYRSAVEPIQITAEDIVETKPKRQKRSREIHFRKTSNFK